MITFPITQVDTSGHLSVAMRPDPVDYPPWIIAALVLVVIWMWVHGILVIWFSTVKQRWPFPNTHPSMAFCRQRWRWKFLGWPLLWFWKTSP